MSMLFLSMPLIIITLGALLLMLLSAFKPLSTTQANRLTLFILALVILFELPLTQTQYSTLLFSELFNKMLISDSFSALFILLFTLGTLFTLAISNRYLKRNGYFINEFFALMLFSLLGMMLLAMANELLTAFIALEIASLSIYIMIGLHRSDKKKVEAFYKYLLIGSFAGSFFLLGTLFIYLQVGSTHLDTIAHYIQSHPLKESQLLIVGGAMLMVTIFFKIGAFFFHAWILDVYDGASMPVTMYMAAVFKIAVFSIALRIFLVDFKPYIEIFQPVIEMIAFLTLIGGSLLTLKQNSIKRMLAASSIVHSGYMLIALASFDHNAIIAGSALIFYLLAYFLSAVGSLGVLSYISSDSSKKLTFEGFKGLAKTRPYLALSMAIFMLSLAGFPSTIGFLGKFYIFTAGIASGHYLLVSVGIFAAFVSIYYYFRVIAMIYFYDATQKFGTFRYSLSYLGILFIAFITIWGGIGTGLLSFIPGANSIILYAQKALASLF